MTQRNIKELDLNLLWVLDTLLDEGNVTRAAKRLRVTQPAVSRMLGRLRQALADPLFVATSRGMIPTARALELAAPLKEILARIETVLVASDFDPQAAEHTFSVAATDYAQHTLMVPVAQALAVESPRSRLAIHPILSHEVAEQLARGQIDVAFSVHESAPADAQSRVLYEERYICAARKDHPVVRRTLSLRRFCELDHVIVSPDGGGFSGATDRALAALGMERRVALSVPSFLAVPAFLKASDLVAVAPERLIRNYSEHLNIFRPPLEIPGFKLIAVWHARTQHSPAHIWFRELLVRCATA